MTARGIQGPERRPSTRIGHSNLGLFYKLLFLWTGAIVVAFIAVTVSIYSTPDEFGLNGVLEVAALVIGLLAWLLGLGLLRFMAFVFNSRRRRPAGAALRRAPLVKAAGWSKADWAGATWTVIVLAALLFAEVAIALWWGGGGFAPSKFGIGILALLLALGLWSAGFVVFWLLALIAASALDVVNKRAGRSPKDAAQSR